MRIQGNIMAQIETSGVGGSSPVNLTPVPLNNDIPYDTPVKTLEDLKNVLVSHMGEKRGMELYNFFLSSIVTASVVQMQQTSQNAQQAAKEMSDDQT